VLVLIIAGVAGFLTYVGAPVAERFDIPHRVVSGALQFAAGVVTALVAFSLMPPALRNGATPWIILAFFLGGVLFVGIEALSLRFLPDTPAEDGRAASPGFYVGILVDLLVDGVVIGLGATLTLATGVLLALGMAISTAPLAFVATATAKRQGIAAHQRKRLAYLFIVAIVGGASLGYLVLRDQPVELRLGLVALASGFLITTVTQSMIPEANREGEPGFAGILFMGGLSLYGLMALTIK
jgi:ZIP family zinc transporter